MNRGKRNFLASKIRTGSARPTRATQPLPNSAPSKGMNQATSRQHYTMDPGMPGPDELWHAGMGIDAYPEPMIQHAEGDIRLDDFDPAGFANGLPILELRLAQGSSADKMRVDWGFSNPAQATVFDFDIRVNGTPFINNRFRKPYNSTYPIEFFRKMDTQTMIQFFLVLKPGAVIVPPLGNICTWLIIDGYRGTYRG